MLTECNYTDRDLWLATFFAAIPPTAVTTAFLAQLYEYYDRAVPTHMLRDMDYLAKYERFDGRVVQRVTATLVARAQSDSRFGWPLGDLLDGHGEVGSRLRQLFGSSAEDAVLLKQAYLAAAFPGSHLDYNAAAFGILLDLDPDFGAKWVDWMYNTRSANRWVTHHDDHRDYSGLWLRDDYARVLKPILARVMYGEAGRFGLFSYGAAFLRVVDKHPDADAIHERQDQLFASWVRDNATDREQMRFVFALASSFHPDRRCALLRIFLDKNQSFDDFSHLDLEPNTWSVSGSEVPLYQRRVEFFQSLLPLFNDLRFLDHRQAIDKRIAGLRKAMEAEKRNDFLEA